MGVIKTNVVYAFLGFVVNPQQRTITKQSQTIDLGKKSFDILVLLLERHGELITKDELLAAAWPNQIITDSAFNKQIARIRKAIDPADANASAIETVRGVGVRMDADVKIISEQPATKSSSIKLFIVASLVLPLGFLAYHLYDNFSDTDSPDPRTEAIAANTLGRESINIAIVPAQKSNDWLDIGGLNYLAELLQKHDEIGAIDPQTDWFKQEGSKVLALRLSQTENINYTLIIETIEQQEQFIAKTLLRNEHGVLAEGKLQSKTLTNLFEEMESWTIQQLNITSGVVFADAGHEVQVTGFALESYLRGLAAARNRDFAKAERLLRTTVDQNKLFFPAWLLLAEVEAESGNFQKSLATIETTEKLDGFDDSYLNDLYNTKARTLIYLNRLSDAQLLIDKSMTLSQQNGDMKAIIVSLSSLAMIQDRTGISQETSNILQRQLELVERHNPLPDLVAKLNHNLAIVNQHLSNYDEAIVYVELAIAQFQASQNHTGLVSSYRVKGNILYNLAQTGQSLLALEKAEKWLDEVDSPIVLTHFYGAKARSLSALGYLTRAMSEIDKIHDIGIKYDNIEAKIIALTIQAESQVVYDQLSDAQHTVRQILEIIALNPDGLPANADYIAALDMYLSARTDSAIIAREKMQHYLSSYPDLNDSISFELSRIRAHIFAAEGFRNKAIDMLSQLMDNYIDENQFLDASYVGFEILELRWKNNMGEFLKTVNRIQEYTTFDYPVLKYRAKYFAHKENFVSATILMQELKPKAREFWTADDQILMEAFQKKIQNTGVTESSH